MKEPGILREIGIEIGSVVGEYLILPIVILIVVYFVAKAINKTTIEKSI